MEMLKITDKEPKLTCQFVSAEFDYSNCYGDYLQVVLKDKSYVKKFKRHAILSSIPRIHYPSEKNISKVIRNSYEELNKGE